VSERTDSELLRDYAENGSEAAFAQLVGRQTFADALVGGATRFAGSLQGFRVTSQEPERDNRSPHGHRIDQQGWEGRSAYVTARPRR
jgi:hypothetical protein